jgi:hypothetical protein
MNHLLAVVLAAATLLGLPATSAAHTMGNGYLDLTVDGSTATGELDLAVRDLHDAVGLDTNHDGQVRWLEIHDRLPELQRYVLDHLTISAGVAGAAPCTISFSAAGIVSRADGEHLALPLTARCDRELTALTLDYRAIFEVDAQHRGLVRIARKGRPAPRRCASSPIPVPPPSSYNRPAATFSVSSSKGSGTSGSAWTTSAF